MKYFVIGIYCINITGAITLTRTITVAMAMGVAVAIALPRFRTVSYEQMLSYALEQPTLTQLSCV